MEEKRICEKIRKPGSHLVLDIEWTPAFERELLAQDVVHKANFGAIRTPLDDSSKASRLLDHIEKDPIPRYHGFVVALRETGQTGILKILGETSQGEINVQEHLPAAARADSGGRDEDIEAVGEKLKVALSRSVEIHSLDLDSLFVYLIAYGILTDNQCDEVKAQPTQAKKMLELIARLKSRAPKHYVLFAKAIRKSDQAHFLDEFKLTAQELKVINEIEPAK